MSDALNERLKLIRFRRKRERSTFRQELKVIPRWLVWLCIGLWLVGLMVGLLINVHLYEQGGPAVMFPGDGSIRNLTSSCAALAAVITLAALVVSTMLFMLAYVYRDAKRRGMNAGLWTLLVLILSPAYLLIGLIIYLLVREPLPYNCPQCGTTVNARFNFCPNCKYNLHPACPQCQQEVSDTDKFCPHCGAEQHHTVKPTAETPATPSV